MSEGTDGPKGPPLYLDDLHVGQRFFGGYHRVDAEQIKNFARQFDPQPFHLDEDGGQRSMFGGLVASGWHTGAISMRLMVEAVPIAGGLIGASGEIRWTRPVRPGDTLHVECEIIEVPPLPIAPRPGHGHDPQRDAQSIGRSRRDSRGSAGRAAPAVLKGRRHSCFTTGSKQGTVSICGVEGPVSWEATLSTRFVRLRSGRAPRRKQASGTVRTTNGLPSGWTSAKMGKRLALRAGRPGPVQTDMGNPS